MVRVLTDLVKLDTALLTALLFFQVWAQGRKLLCRLRVIEHNVLVISKYYSRITTERLATLLCLTEKEVRLQPDMTSWWATKLCVLHVQTQVCRHHVERYSSSSNVATAI